MKNLIILLFALIAINSANAQCCLPEGITFTTQEQIDNFQTNYPGCTEIEGEVTINGPGITNLNGLNMITSIGGNLIIIKNDLLTNLSGLDALTYIGGYLEIGDVGDEGNPLLTSLNGLENLTSTGHGLTIRFNPVLTSFDGLENLTSLGTGGFLLIQVNEALTDLTALSNLNTVGGSLRVEDNASLTTLAGLENIIPGSIDNLFINRNPLLSSCEVQSICEYLASPTGTVFIFDNAQGCEHPADIAVSCGTTFDCLPHGFYHFYSQSYIDNFHLGFPGCTVLNEYAVISGDNINNLNGLSQITSVDGDLWILGNPLLTSLSGLDNLSSITGELEISGNTALTDLTGLEGLTSIEENLLIGYWYPNSNTVLASLSGLANLTTLGGELSIKQTLALTSLAGLDNITPNSINDITITDNTLLSSCDVESVCIYLGFPNSMITVSNNATGCNSIQELSEACLGIGMEEVNPDKGFTIIPNPVNGIITISHPGLAGTAWFTLFNTGGGKVFERQITGTETQIDISSLPRGVYVVRLQNEKMVEVGKIIRE